MILAVVGGASIVVSGTAESFASTCPPGYSCDLAGTSLAPPLDLLFFLLFIMGVLLLGASGLVALNAWNPRHTKSK